MFLSRLQEELEFESEFEINTNIPNFRLHP